MMSRYRFCCLFLMIHAVAFGAVDTSATDSSWLKRTLYNNVKLSGDIMLRGEVYGSSASEGRKSPYFGEVSISPSLTIGNAVTVSSLLAVTTEKMEFNRTLSRFGIVPSWSWGTFHAGEFSQSYSDFTLDGIPLFGAAFELQPGNWQVSSCYGRYGGILSNRDLGIPHRNVGAANIGYRTPKGLSVNIIVLKAQDKLSTGASSVKKPDLDSLFDSLNIIDSMELALSGYRESFSAVTPQENAVASCIINVPLLGEAVQLQAEVAGCLFSSDRMSPRLEYTDKWKQTGGILDNIFTPRISSHFDMAIKGNIRLRKEMFDGSLGGIYIGTGYRSLGLPYLQSDRREVAADAGYFRQPWMVRLSGSYGGDNLIGQKLSTTHTKKIQASTSFSSGRFPESSLQCLIYSMTKPLDTLLPAMDFRSVVVSGTHRYPFVDIPALKDVSLDYSYQTSRGTGASGRIQVATESVGLSVTLPAEVALQSTIGVASTEQSAERWQHDATGSLSISKNLMEDRLSNQFRVSGTAGRNRQSLNNALSVVFTVYKALAASLDLSAYLFAGNDMNSMREYSAQLGVSHSF